MTVSANSYGAASDVAALTWSWVSDSNGYYNQSTLPALSQVEGWIDQVSAIMNTCLRKWGFETPLTDAEDVLAVKSVVIGHVADMANYANATGRFFTERNLASGSSPFAIIRKEIDEWVENSAEGLNSEQTLETASEHTFSYSPTRDDGYYQESL